MSSHRVSTLTRTLRSKPTGLMLYKGYNLGSHTHPLVSGTVCNSWLCRNRARTIDNIFGCQVLQGANQARPASAQMDGMWPRRMPQLVSRDISPSTGTRL